MRSGDGRSWILAGEGAPGRPAVAALAPEVFFSFDRIREQLLEVVPAEVIDLCRARMAVLLGAAEVSREARRPVPPALGERDLACLAIAEQFLIDVTGIGQADIDRLLAHFTPAETYALLNALWFEEAMLRLELFSESPGRRPLRRAGAADVPPRIPLQGAAVDEFGVVDTTLIVPALGEARQRMVEALAALDRVDPVTHELCRLLNADLQRCRVCLRYRYTDAEEELLGAARGYEDSEDRLTGRQKLALRLSDLYLRAPAVPDGSLSQALLEESTPAEILELLLRQVRYTWNKTLVALRFDGNDEAGPPAGQGDQPPTLRPLPIPPPAGMRPLDGIV